jgi:hypothetical protein
MAGDSSEESSMATDKEAPEVQPEGPGPQALDAHPDSTGSAQEEQDKKRKGRQRGIEDTFTGRAAQLAVISQLLNLRCNAAIPEVDLGTDVFAFKDDREEVVRIQVKACTKPYPYADGTGYSAVFTLPIRQLKRLDDRPPLYYALAVMRDGNWSDFLVVSRVKLREYYDDAKPFGSLDQVNEELRITVAFRDKVECSGRDLTECRNAWNSLPPLRETPDLGPAPTETEAIADAATGELSAPPGQP